MTVQVWECLSIQVTPALPSSLATWIQRMVAGDEEAQPFFQRAIELGITFWDTANVYGIGSAEEIVGRELKKFGSRDDIVLATKVNFPMHEGPGGSGMSRKAIMEQIDASLSRLDTGYVDLYQIHRFD